ncbi:MAG TPA: glycosyltransferase family 4 protein [Falsiroseomonas sp.]|jgi:glycosyltransferase involved in cell wall biosynthesis|nr:glycosyltransferase family 4 protein [Falsiroseomonas sp.]
MRVLLLSPGHPALQPGGTEVLAQGLFRTLRERHGVEGLLLAAVDPAQRAPLPGTRLQPIGGGAPDDELLVALGGFDRFHLAQPDALGLVATLGPIIARLRPDIIHLHHLLHWGVETLDLLRRLAPRTPLVVTLHDYFALCPREGQMLTSEGRPCHGPSPDACRRCLPERSAGDLAMRRSHLGGALRAADMLVAPSDFLHERFLAAGWDPARLTTIRNGIAAGPPAPHRAAPDGRRDRFAMLGQLTRFKGALVALRASARLSARGVAHRLDLHGPLARHSASFLAEFEAALAAAPDARHHGAYAPRELPGLIAGADWVLVPSLWWENAPLVILEAQHHRRPVVCTGIGGMAELVAPGVTGLHVPPDDPHAWAATLELAVSSEGLWQRLAARIAIPRDLAAVADEHMALYGALLAERRSRRRPAAA